MFLDPAAEPAEQAGVALVIGHTASFNPIVRKMHRLVVDEEFGRLGFITASAYTDFLYRPRRPEGEREDGGGDSNAASSWHGRFHCNRGRRLRRGRRGRLTGGGP